MKNILYTTVFILTLGALTIINAQESGVIWIKTFQPGSSDISGPEINPASLAILDSLMQDENIEVTFLGAADKKAWRLNGESVHEHVSEAWNDAKRLSRARALRARYGRGTVGITHEDIAGVKVVWRIGNPQENYTKELNELKEELAQVKTDLQGMNGTHGKNGHEYEPKESTFDWGLQGGMWGWTSGSKGIAAPALALNIIMDKTTFVIQGGVTPWSISGPYGSEGQSFVYSGVKHMTSDWLGFSAGVFRGWEFYTSTDSWSFTTTGLATGVVLKYNRFEFTPTVTYSRSSYLEKDSKWGFGTSLGMNVNLNSW